MSCQIVRRAAGFLRPPAPVESSGRGRQNQRSERSRRGYSLTHPIDTPCFPWPFAAGRFAAGPVAVMPSGCVTSSKPHATEVVSADVASQSGNLLLAPHTNRDVYYGTPYAATPTLDVPSHWGHAVVVIQTPTHFRVANVSNSDLTVEWKANGLKAPPVSQAALGASQIQRPIQAPAVQPVAASMPAAPPYPSAPAAPPQNPTPRSPGDGLPAGAGAGRAPR